MNCARFLPRSRWVRRRSRGNGRGVDDREMRGVAGEDAAGIPVDRYRDVAGQGHPVHAALVGAEVRDAVVLGRAVVPDHQIARRPGPAQRVLEPNDALLQELEQCSRLVGLESHEFLDEMTEEQRPLAGFGMHAHDRVLDLELQAREVLHRLVTVDRDALAVGVYACVVVLVRVHRPQAVDEGLQGGGKLLVSRGGRGPRGGATVGRDVDRSQDRCLRDPVDEADVGVPAVGGALDDERPVVLGRQRRMGGGLRAEGAGEPVLDVVGDVVLAAEDDDLVRGEGVADRVRGLGGDVPGDVHALDQGADVLAESGDGDAAGGVDVVRGGRAGLDGGHDCSSAVGDGYGLCCVSARGRVPRARPRCDGSDAARRRSRRWRCAGRSGCPRQRCPLRSSGGGR